MPDKIIILQETRREHMIRDTYSVALILFMFWCNYTFIGGSYIVNAFAVVMLGVIGFRRSKAFKESFEYTIEGAQKELAAMVRLNKWMEENLPHD